MRSGSSALLLAMVGLLAGCTASGSDGTPTEQGSATAVPSASAPSLSFEALQSGVVRIETTDCQGVSRGSGFMVGEDLVATVAHVVDGARTIALRTPDGVIRGEVLGVDTKRDVALVHAVKPLPGHVFKMADEAPDVTDEVLVLGYPGGRPLTATKGAVSGLNRRLEFPGSSMSGLVQTDAAVNRGNSGGPMLDASQNVVGIVEAKILGEAEGLAYAVPVSVAAPLIDAWMAAPDDVPAPRCSDPFADRVENRSLHPEAPALASAFDHYIDGINSKFYASAWNVLTGDAKGRYGDLGTFAEEQSTSTISDFVLEKASWKDETADTADVRFVTRQDPLDGPEGQECTIWHLRYTMRMDSGTWLIDEAKNLEPPTDCSASSATSAPSPSDARTTAGGL